MCIMQLQLVTRVTNQERNLARQIRFTTLYNLPKGKSGLEGTKQVILQTFARILKLSPPGSCECSLRSNYTSKQAFSITACASFTSIKSLENTIHRHQKSDTKPFEQKLFSRVRDVQIWKFNCPLV